MNPSTTGPHTSSGDANVDSDDVAGSRFMRDLRAASPAPGRPRTGALSPSRAATSRKVDQRYMGFRPIQHPLTSSP